VGRAGTAIPAAPRGNAAAPVPLADAVARARAELL